jgi:hypothetical protein
MQQRIQDLSINELEFDKENPRLPHSVIDSNDENEVIDWMLSDASIIELMGSIAEKGFFPAEPLLVVPAKQKGKYVVVEGNRRLTAAKLLLHPSLAKKRTAIIKEIRKEAKHIPKFIPSIIYPKRQDILDYLGFKHITGVKAWPALAKAKYLRQLQNLSNEKNINAQYKSLAKSIGSRADYVKELLIGLDVYDKIYQKKFFHIKGLNENSIEFGVYYNALRYSNIPKYLGIDKSASNPTKNIKIDKLNNIVKWISEKGKDGTTKLGESRNLSVLNEIVGNKQAVYRFEHGESLEDAKLFTEEPETLFSTALSDALRSLSNAKSIVTKLTAQKPSDSNLIDEISNEIVIIKENLRQISKGVKILKRKNRK